MTVPASKNIQEKEAKKFKNILNCAKKFCKCGNKKLLKQLYLSWNLEWQQTPWKAHAEMQKPVLLDTRNVLNIKQ